MLSALDSTLSLSYPVVAENTNDANEESASSLAVESRLAKLETKLSILVYVAIVLIPAAGVVYWYLNGISRDLGTLNARVDGYQNEALLKVLSPIRADVQDTAAGKEVKDAIRKIAEETLKREQANEPVSSSVYYELGKFAYGNGNAEQAIDYFNKAVAANPLDYRAWSSLSAVYLAVSDQEPAKKDNYASKAKQAAEKALGIDPHHGEAYSNLGIARFMLGDKPGAVDAEKKAIEIDRRFDAAYYNLACMYASDNWDPHKSLQYLELAVTEAGYNNPKEMTADEAKCFRSIKDTGKFRQLKAVVVRRARAVPIP